MKHFLSLLAALLLAVAFSAPAVYADHFDSDGWYVEFTGSEMTENFNSGTINEIFSSVEPGDSATVTITLRNSSSSETMWYMHNEAINTLEQIRKSAEGGLYAYKLTYISSSGETNVLYDSTQVGGENADKRDPEGLNQISDKLKNYFYLDNFKSGQKGVITLYMELEGETQGNGYQNTNAAVEVQFAVEPVAPSINTTTTLYSDRPRTADDTSVGIYLLLMAVTFMTLLIGSKNKKRFMALFLCVLMVSPLFATGRAHAEDYDYVITVYTGNIGKIGGTDKKFIPVSKGDQVNLGDVMYGGVTLKNDKYYVRGIRLAGRDNVEESLNSLYFTADQDAEYCVAYGVKGTLTSYTVRYVDANGRELAPSQTLYGNVGDKPVVAFKYFDGYQPNAHNLKKTLIADAASNVFTFTYTPIVRETNTTTTVVETGNTGTAGTGGNAENNNANAQAQPNTDAETEDTAPAAEDTQPAEANPTDEEQEAPAPAPVETPEPEVVAPATPQPPVPTYNPEAVATAAPVELIDLDEVAQNGAFTIGDVAVPLATLQARADNGDRSAKIALVVKYSLYSLLVLLVCGLVTALIVISNRKRAEKSAYAAAPIRDMSYDNNTKAVYYSPADYNVDDLFDKRS